MRPLGSHAATVPTHGVRRERDGAALATPSDMSHALGPNTRLIESFLARVARLSHAELKRVVQTWRHGGWRSDAWYAAEDAVGEAIARTRRDDEMWLLQDEIYALFRGTPWYQLADAPPEVASQYLVTTAAVALLVAEALDREHLRTLYAPFAETISLAALALTPRGFDVDLELPDARA